MDPSFPPVRFTAKPGSTVSVFSNFSRCTYVNDYSILDFVLNISPPYK